MLRCIQRSETDPYYNLAAEEFLLMTATTDTFMIWSNEPSVIIGKHQNTSKEINHSYIESHKLPVVRRLSGGGTVYQDLGNVNFSFIYTDRKENLVDFRQFTKPIILFLQELGLNAAFQGKNNITVAGLKVSGNSAHIYKNKVLHHGSLLFNTDLEALHQALKGSEKLYKDKSVNSVRAKVTNVSYHIKNDLSGKDFIGLFRSFIHDYYPGCFDDVLHGKETEAISKLAENKYKKYEWNFGYSPDYMYDAQWEMHNGNFCISLFVSDGLIRKAEISGPENHLLLLKAAEKEMIGAFHDRLSVSERLKKLTFASENEKLIVNQIVQHLS